MEPGFAAFGRGGHWGSAVAVFLSTFQNKVDRKGRVSVPAPFRAALAGQNFAGVVLFPSMKGHRCLDGFGWDKVEELSASVAALDHLSDEREALQTLFASANQLAFDIDGRILLTEDLREVAGIGENAVFVGRGDHFQIWEPEAHKRHAAEMLRIVIDKKLTVPSKTGGKPS